MAFYDTLPILFGQPDTTSWSGFVDVAIGLAIFFAVTILPFFVGRFLARSVRMPCAPSSTPVPWVFLKPLSNTISLTPWRCWR